MQQLSGTFPRESGGLRQDAPIYPQRIYSCLSASPSHSRPRAPAKKSSGISTFLPHAKAWNTSNSCRPARRFRLVREEQRKRRSRGKPQPAYNEKLATAEARKKPLYPRSLTPPLANWLRVSKLKWKIRRLSPKSKRCENIPHVRGNAVSIHINRQSTKVDSSRW